MYSQKKTIERSRPETYYQAQTPRNSSRCGHAHRTPEAAQKCADKINRVQREREFNPCYEVHVIYQGSDEGVVEVA
jgi:hypothetical protein